MALSPAKKASDARHVAKLDVIKIQPYKEEGATIRAAATEAGQSLQSYVLQAVRERMFREESIGSREPPSPELQMRYSGTPSSLFSWDYGLSPEQRSKRLEDDHKRLVELCAIRSNRDLSEKEYLEFMYLLMAHKDD